MSLQKDNIYESEASLYQYLDLHFTAVNDNGQPLDRILVHECAPVHALSFPQRVGQLLISLVDSYESALDVGGSVGGTAFELATAFGHVDSFDYSKRFVESAQCLANGQSVPFQIKMEGDSVINASILPPVIREGSTISFFVGDACQMEQIPELSMGKQYDAVVLANLLCRLPDPQACLQSVANMTRSGGVVLLVTPFTWLEQYTPREHWIVGNKNDGDSNTDSLTELSKRMSKLGFEMIHEENMPLLIREHARKYQYIISKATGWRKSKE